MNKILCGNCGGKVKLPAGYAKAKIRCEHCGYYAEVPPDQRSAAPPEDDAPPSPPKSSAPQPPPSRRARLDDDAGEAPPPKPPPKKKDKPTQVRARSDPRDPRPEFVVEEGAGPPLIEGTQEDDDGPYTVHGTGLKKCPECREELPLDATFCVHCGGSLIDDNSRPMKKKRTFTVIDETFVQGWSLKTRLILFAGVQVVNVLFTLLAVAANDWKFDATSIVTGAFVTFMQIGLQAFILGSYDTVNVFRDERGRATLSRIRRIAFAPMRQAKIPWKQAAGVGRVATHAGTLLAWLTCLYLFCCLFFVPGILFWWFELRPNRQNVVLCDLYGGVEELVFQARDTDEADRVIEAVSEATTLTNRGTV
jgi:hypothetical protein